jgi:hypothetical protein
MMQFARRVARRIAREMDIFRQFRERGLEFRNDPNCRLDLVAEGFLSLLCYKVVLNVRAPSPSGAM